MDDLKKIIRDHSDHPAVKAMLELMKRLEESAKERLVIVGIDGFEAVQAEVKFARKMQSELSPPKWLAHNAGKDGAYV